MGLIIGELNKSFGELVLFRDFSITLAEGAVNCLLGPSGCGKTTLLNILSGLMPMDNGEFYRLDGRPVSYIFQEPRLLPWQTVSQNLSFVLKGLYPEPERDALVAQWIEHVGLKGFENEFPKNLSGGMKQRVAIARAFLFPSDLLLMDEPFKGLDVKLKMSVFQLFQETWRQNRKSVIFVTHDIDEALMLGQRISVLSKAPVTVTKEFLLSQRMKGASDDQQRQALLEKIKGELLAAL